MTTVNIKGLELSFEAKDGFITLTNDQLGIKYMACYTMADGVEYSIVGADFSDETCKYVTLQINMRGEVIDFELLSDIMYEVRLAPFTAYDARFRPQNNNDRIHLGKMAEIQSELLRNRIEHYYYRLSAEKRIAELEAALADMLAAK